MPFAETTILLIDDDETLLELFGEHVRTAGYRVLTANRGDRGIELVEKDQTDLIVLDVMMPGMDGWEVCHRIRQRSSVPIIMLTAKDQEIDKLRGFRLGVDDYVTKPFSFAEVVARIRAVINRISKVSPVGTRLSTGDLVIDFSRRQITNKGEIVELTPTEFKLLRILAQHVNRPVPTEILLQEVWGDEYVGTPDNVKHYIWSLRKKIELDPGDPKHILTERGFGYRFN